MPLPAHILMPNHPGSAGSPLESRFDIIRLTKHHIHTPICKIDLLWIIIRTRISTVMSSMSKYKYTDIDNNYYLYCHGHFKELSLIMEWGGDNNHGCKWSSTCIYVTNI